MVHDFDEGNLLNENSSITIHFESFLGILIFMSLSYNDYDANTRILYFFHRLSQSKGMKIITIKKGSSK
jgi:hypothetical protein